MKCIDDTEKGLGIELSEEPGAVKRQIIPTLVSRDKDRKLLESAPNSDFMDLAIVYRVINKTVDGYYTAPVTHELLDALGLSFEELCGIGAENMKLYYPHRIVDVKDTVKILTNSEGVYGASSVLDEAALLAAYDAFEGAFYLMPVSAHEIIMVKFGAMEPDEMRRVFCSGIGEIASEADCLQGSIYMYDAENGGLSYLKID